MKDKFGGSMKDKPCWREGRVRLLQKEACLPDPGDFFEEESV